MNDDNDVVDEHLVMRASINSKAAGSSYVEHGKSKTICSVFGPHEISRDVPFSLRAKLDCKVTLSPMCKKFNSDDDFAMQNAELSQHLFTCCYSAILLHKYPKTQIDIRVLVISNLSSTIFSDVVVAAGIALCDAGIEMYDVLTADTIVNEDKMFLSLAFLPNVSQVCGLRLRTINGKNIALDDLKCLELINECKLKCQQQATLVRRSLLQSYTTD
ncbi:hypothetical protein GJ496_006560 [Pomphorhynchus laevis]|nr:hypothetical protein GJ496_006560 [Pomphorhynchus laevis]